MTPLRLILSFTRRARFRPLSSRRMGPAYVALALLTLPAGVLIAHRAGAQQDPLPATGSARTRHAGALTMPLSVDWKFTSVFVPNNPASPIVTNDTIYFAAGNRLYAVDPDTGAQKWRYPEGESVLQTQVMGTPALDHGILYFGTGEGLYAVDATTGKQIWQPFLVKGGIATSPVVIDNGIYFASQIGQFYGVNAKTGEALEGVYSQATRTGGIKTGGDMEGDLSVVDNTAYYVTANNQALHAVDLTTGIQRWAVRLQADVHNTVPILNGDTITMPAAFLLILGGVVLESAYTSISAVVKAELFPTAVRSLGVALPYALANAIFGGTAEYVAFWFKAAGVERGFYVYASVVSGISFLVALSMKDSRTHSRIVED